MGLESQMRAGRRLTLSGRDPTAVAEEWRDVAKEYRYQLGQLDDKDLALGQKKSCVYCYTNLLPVFVDDPASDAPKLRYLPTQPCFRSPF
jgi:hypothetical protein